MKELDIGQVAKLSGVAPSKLRFYEKKGLIRSVGRNGLRRQYSENVLNKLQLITLGQTAGFTLDEMAGMFGTPDKVSIDREKLHNRAQEIDRTIRKLRILSQGLKHAAKCTAQDHTQCEEFKKVVSRGQRILAK
ncbi:helix-turn-helix domain-containing protein [Buttiauxella sp. A111]|uniref:helix-turn-helix domain-containing protein n=1 Tax=Buttiauxella sp. A111 TaxID=2563088 RepID=UPI0010E66ECD|nr:helix-turn-helix domain-containing protein [Buttiauxella sp. A111]GDX06282.1 MerR family DNA-binding transcriptional regulator [Buttiauxella sp. A111]